MTNVSLNQIVIRILVLLAWCHFKSF